jgi:O-antigen/teichoic acid export membrane protein
MSARPQSQSGARSGALLAAASAVSIVTAYVFLLAAGRILGSDDYGSLAALLGVLAVVQIPAGALQMAISRDVSRYAAAGDDARATRLARGTLRWSAIATVPLLALGLALSPALSHVLHIDSIGIVVLAIATLVSTFLYPLAMGVLQGYQRFHAVAGLYLVPWIVRLVLLGILAAAGFRLGGAVGATFVGAAVSTVVGLALIRGPVRAAGALPRAELVAFLRYLAPVAIGLVGIALLAHVDILIVKARFSAHDAGAYAAASAFARVGFFLPATILAVLFPRTAARQARGEETEDILGRSLLATGAFCGALTLVYAATGVGLVSLTFGPDFAAGGAVLGPFALAIGLFSLANILVGYHLSRGETRYAWIVGAGVVAQVVALSTIPSSLHGVVWTDVVIGVVLLAAHEIFVGSSVPALRAGVRHFAPTDRARVRRITLEGLTVVAATTLFVCVLMWPIVVHMGSTIIGTLGSDSTGGVWWFWQLNHESGYHILGTTHHTLTGAPFGWDEGNGLNLQWLLPYYPGYLATKIVGEVAAFNLVTLSGYVLSGVSMYALTRYLGCGRLVAAWAAFAFVIFPWHVARAEHASLVHIEVLVWLVLALVAAVRTPTMLRFAFVGVATLACWFTSGYYGAEALVTALAFAGGAALVVSRRRLYLVGGIGGAALGATAIIGIAALLSGTNRGAGLERQATDLASLGLRPLELVVPPAGSLVFGDSLKSYWASHLHGSNTTEITNFAGWVTLLLAAFWVVTWARRRRDAVTAGLLAALVVGFLFALPSPWHGIVMPSRLLWELVPAFRVPSRWEPLLMTMLVALAALGLQRVAGGMTRRAGAAIVAVALALSFAELAIHTATPRFRTTPAPPEYAAVARTSPGILAEYPLASSDVFRFWQRVHGRPLVDNAPGTASTNDDVRLVLLDPAVPGTAQSLSLLGVTALVIHAHAIVDAEVLPGTPPASEGYSKVAITADGSSVWRVTAAPAPALVTLTGGFSPPRRLSDGTVGFPLSSTSGVAAVDLRAKVAGVVRVVFDVVPPKVGGWNLRVADAQREQPFTITGRTAVAVNVAVPRGHSRLLLKVDPAATSDADALVITVPRAEPPSGPAALNAQKLSDDPGF